MSDVIETPENTATVTTQEQTTKRIKTAHFDFKDEISPTGNRSPI